MAMNMAKTHTLSKGEIKALAEVVGASAASGDIRDVVQLLKPVLDSKCPFANLDRLGKEIGTSSIASGELSKVIEAFDSIVDYNAMGGYVIVGQALIWFLPHRFETVMEKSREYIIKGNVWYVCDIIGERSLGHALVSEFDKTLVWLEKFIKDKNRWVKRSVGVAIHFFSKRVPDEPEKTEKLLTLVEPYIEEKQIDFVKGIGWGLKTMGRYHPDIVVRFLNEQLIQGKDMSKTLIRKAVTYLDEEKKKEVTIN